MENRYSRWLYDHSPVCAQNLFSSIYGLKKRLDRYRGDDYKRFLEFFRACEGWSVEELRAYQNERLTEVIRHAYDYVPFYRQRFDALKLRPDDIRTVDDLPKLPLLTKDDIRGAGADMTARGYPRRKALVANTSGSTGYPLTLWRSRRSNQMEYAFTWARRRPGVCRGRPYASFTGIHIVRSDSFTPPFWRMNWASRQRCYSVFHMTDETMPLYLDDLNRHPMDWFQGYATPIYLLAEFVLDKGYPFTAYPKAVFTTSEQLLPGYREAIETAFHTKLYDQYGLHEQTCSITEYPCGHMHEDMEYAITEFIPVGREGDATVAEIVGTALYNEAMPLIRYRCGDLALLPDHPPACNAHPSRIVSAIYGRTNHVIVTGDGRKISNISVIVTRCRNVNAVQCIQDEPGTMRLRVVKGPCFSAEDEAELLRQFRLRVGEQTEVRVEYASDVLRTSSGKTLAIISNVGKPQPGAAAKASGQEVPAG
jgi:phenylacetate-CoA ligase